MLGKKIYILFAEDIKTDFELAVRTLRKGGINFESKLVDSKDKFIKAIEENRPDIIISDYSMPEFDGMTALKTARAIDPTIPFIILTGSMNEETAVSCMKEGANDYVIKELISRLPYAVNETLIKHKMILEKEIVERELFEKTEELNNYFTNALDLFCIAGIDGTFLRLNNAWEKTLGYRMDELIGENFIKFVHPEDIESTKRVLSKLENKEEVSDFENRYICKDGNYKWIEWRSKSSGDKIYAAARDITDRKNSEQEIFELSERLQHYLATSQTITYALRINNKSVLPFWISENVTRILGYEIQEVLNETWWSENLYPEDKKSTAEEFENFRTSGNDTYIREYRFFTKSKNIIWIRDELRIVKDRKGRPYEIIGTWTDISKRKEAEEDLIKSEKKYRQFFEEDLSSVYLSDVDGNLIDCNPAFVSSFGFKSREEALSSNTIELYENSDERKKFVNLLKERKRIIYYEQKLYKKNKEIIYVIVNAIGIFNSDNVLTKIQGYLFDITEIKNLQNELIKAKETAEKANYLKSEFLAQMSHEIRTPINAILNSASLIKEESARYSNSEVQEFFPVIDSASKRIIRTIDSILNMSELQTGSYNPEFKKFNLVRDILDHLYLEFKSLAVSKKLKYNLIINTNNTDLFADFYSIQQTFSNLIDNAIKYTDAGSVDIIVYRNQHNKLCVDVKDTGMGIAKEFIPEIFDAFRQEHQGYSRKYDGNGLGLALVKNYCKINNSEINLSSEKDFGTTFTLTFA